MNKKINKFSDLNFSESSREKPDVNDYKEKIELERNQDTHAVFRLFKHALKFSAWCIGIAIGILAIIAIFLLGYAMWNHVMGMMQDPEKLTTFMSHSWAFVSGALTTIALITAIKNN